MAQTVNHTGFKLKCGLQVKFFNTLNTAAWSFPVTGQVILKEHCVCAGRTAPKFTGVTVVG